MTSLSEAALALIAELPDNARDVTPNHVDAIVDLQRRIRDAKKWCLETLHGLPAQRPSGADVASIVRISRVELDADRAAAALDDWCERTGMATPIGLPPDPDDGPHVIEEPDGSIGFRVPKQGEE